MEPTMNESTNPQLDDEQRAAVTAPEQYVRVRAGAGTGKTTCLVSRVRYLVQAKDVPPKDLCVSTFSKRAAEEIARRVGGNGIGAFIGTIHALGYRILQYERRNRSIADDRKRSQLILRAIKETGTRESLAYVKAGIARARSFGTQYPADVAAVGRVYERILHDEENLWDFDDLILQPAIMFATEAPIREKWLRRFAHVIVDEAQDTSTLQWDLLTGLVGASTNLYVVGDPGQSIYTWRGAALDGMLQKLEQRFGAPFATYTISRNYRSRGRIIGTANRVLVGKPEHVAVTEARQHTTEPIVPTVVTGTYARHLDQSVTQALRMLQLARIPLTDAVVLGRTHAVLGECEAVCQKLGLPYVIVGGFSFYDRTEIRDVMAYVEYAAGVDQVGSIERFYNRPARYLGRVWFESLQAQGGWAAWERHGPDHFRWPQRYMGDRCDELWAVCQQLHAFGPQAAVRDVLAYVIDGAVGYRKWMRKDGLKAQEAAEDNDADENLKALLDVPSEHESVEQFVAFVDQCRRKPRRVESAQGGLTLSTIHRAKGLEWPVVVLAGLQEGILPHGMGEPEGEERRLYYVAVSRARDALILALSGSPHDDDEAQVSRYVRESIDAVQLTTVAQLREVADGETEWGDGACLLPA